MKIRDDAVTIPGKVSRSLGSGSDRDTVGRWSEAIARGMGGVKSLNANFKFDIVKCKM